MVSRWKSIIRCVHDISLRRRFLGASTAYVFNARSLGTGRGDRTIVARDYPRSVVRRTHRSSPLTADPMSTDDPNSKSEIQNLKSATRRHFFGQCGVGVGAIALNQLLAGDGLAAPPATPQSALRT